MSFSENLQHLRKKERMTQEQLAERLDVSRQAVSKWESAQSYPEMDKILQLCEMFHCDINTLVQGDVTESEKEDTAGYEQQMNRLSLLTATAFSMIIAAVGLFVLLEKLLKDILHEDLLVIGMFVIIAVAVSILIVTGINHEYFMKRYAVIQDFYTENERYNFNRKFAISIAVGVCLIFFGLCLNMGLEYMGNQVLEEIGSGIFLFCVAAAVWIFIYYGMQKEKYEVEKYNQRNQSTLTKGKKLTRKISSVIWLLAVAVFLYMGLARDMFRIAWVVFPIGWILCAVADIIVGDKE